MVRMAANGPQELKKLVESCAHSLAIVTEKERRLSILEASVHGGGRWGEKLGIAKKKTDFLGILASPIADGLNFFFPHGMLRAGSGAKGHRTFE